MYQDDPQNEVTTERRFEGAEKTDRGRLLLLIHYQGGTEVVSLPPDKPLTVGRGTAADIRLLDRSLSRCHAKFWIENGSVCFEDLESTNGTWLRDQRVDCGVLASGDEIKLGEVIVGAHSEAAPTDDVTEASLHGHERFLTILRDELYRSKQFKRSLTVLLVSAELRGDGRVSSWIHRLRGLLRPIDHMALYAPSIVELLLPEMELGEAKQLAQQVSRKGGLQCGLASYPVAGATADRLVGAALHAMQRASAEAPIQFAAGESVQTLQEQQTSEPQQGAGPVINSPAMKELYATVDQIAHTKVPVLIFGETGTGKELIARALHERGPRGKARLCIVNCGAIPESLVESTLFGYERGAFTGADKATPGVFEVASGGTVFLDEIGELTAAAQVVLLRVLETKTIMRVGGNQERSVDVRVVAATHRNLEAMAKEGRFREDLLYRLNAVILKVPPLRKRPEEIPSLANYFIRQASNASNANVMDIDPAALDILTAYNWPGNVRELRNVIERAVVLCGRDVITPENLPKNIHDAIEEPTAPGQPSKEHSAKESIEEMSTGVINLSELHESGAGFRERMASLERQVLVEALERQSWNQTAAARDLDLPLRTLVRKLSKLGIKKP